MQEIGVVMKEVDLLITESGKEFILPTLFSFDPHLNFTVYKMAPTADSSKIARSVVKFIRDHLDQRPTPIILVETAYKKPGEDYYPRKIVRLIAYSRESEITWYRYICDKQWQEIIVNKGTYYGISVKAAPHQWN